MRNPNIPDKIGSHGVFSTTDNLKKGLHPIFETNLSMLYKIFTSYNFSEIDPVLYKVILCAIAYLLLFNSHA